MAATIVLSFLAENTAYNGIISRFVALTPAFVTRHTPALHYIESTPLGRAALNYFSQICRYDDDDESNEKRESCAEICTSKPSKIVID